VERADNSSLRAAATSSPVLAVAGCSIDLICDNTSFYVADKKFIVILNQINQ
jgi:hypothetical protein